MSSTAPVPEEFDEPFTLEISSSLVVRGVVHGCHCLVRVAANTPRERLYIMEAMTNAGWHFKTETGLPHDNGQHWIFSKPFPR